MANDENTSALGGERRPRIEQPPLFELTAAGRLQPPLAAVTELDATANVEVARWWFRRWLEQHGHPLNTVESYSYDLRLFQDLIGPKGINQITARDVGAFLDRSQTRSTRKRRLTSVGRFFDYLVKETKVLSVDPSDGFFPEHIPLKTPNPLFDSEQTALLAAAQQAGPRAETIIRLLLQLGLGRSELLALKQDHIDLSQPESPVVYVFYENPRWRGKERKLAAPSELTTPYRHYLRDFEPSDRLFDLPPQSVNKLVERIGKQAGITKHVTPQLLRDTFAVNQARLGAGEDKLLALLGLADDPRNRVSVQRYLKLGAPPLSAAS